MLSIRKATAQDAPLILDFIRRLAEYERECNAVVATEEDIIRDGFGSERKYRCLIAEWNGASAGFAFFFYNYSTWLGRPGLYLEDLFVKPETRGRGYGRVLLIHLAKIARDHGCGRMEWAVLNWNEPAIQFYRKLGAIPLEDWTVFRLTQNGINRLAKA